MRLYIKQIPSDSPIYPLSLNFSGWTYSVMLPNGQWFHCPSKQGFGPLCKGNQLMATQVGSQIQHLAGATVEHAITICHAPLDPFSLTSNSECEKSINDYTSRVSNPTFGRGYRRICYSNLLCTSETGPCNPFRWQVKAILARLRRWFPCFWDIFVLERTMLKIIRM